MSDKAKRAGPLGLLVAAVLAVGLGWVPLAVIAADQAAQASCASTGTAVVVDPATAAAAGLSQEQATNAAHVMNAAATLGLDRHAQVVGVMTAWGESDLRVLPYGDLVGPDSRGLFQQRADGAWGSLADRMDPTTSATNFYRALSAVPGWQSLEPTVAAHRVQRNADPYYYERWYGRAVAVVTELAGQAAGPAFAAAGQPGPLNLGPVKPHVAAAAAQIDATFVPYAIGGWRLSARDPDGHPAGRALDVMTRSKAEGDAVAAWVQANSAALGVEYVLWWQASWSPARAEQGWRPMASRGTVTADHYDHLHINFHEVPGVGGPLTAAGCPGVATQVSAQGWALPAQGRLSSGFGMRVHPITGVRRLHSGLDVAAPAGTPIHAAAAGVVTYAGPRGGYGNLIVIDHGGGIVTRYAHMETDGLHVSTGQQVTAGQHVADVGSAGLSTGPHLHFEVQVGGQFVDPDPFLAVRGVAVTSAAVSA